MFDNVVYKAGEVIDNSWIKWFHWDVPDEENGERELIRNVLALLYHCLNCTALSGCYFAFNNKPKMHINCDCDQFSAGKPYKEVKANCDIRKFTEYIFNEKYKDNGKNKLFGLLGFLKEDAEYLKQQYEKQAQDQYLKGNYVFGKLDQYGQRITIAIDLRNDVKIQSGWLVHPLGLITCTTPLGG